MGDFAGILKLLGLVAVSIGVTAIAWLTVENGGLVFKSGNIQPPNKHVKVSTPQDESNFPAIQAPLKTSPIQKRQPTSDAIYKWVDENGTLHFSDRPDQPSAETVRINPVATYKFPDVQRPGVALASFSPPKGRTQVLQVAYSVDGLFAEIPADRISRGIFQTRNGYHINAVAKHLGSRLSFEGRVEGGQACRTLRLGGVLVNSQGKRHHFEAYAHDVGSGSRLFESHDQNVNWVKAGWEVETVSVSCRER